MTLEKLINLPCTIIRRSDSAEEDDYGNALAGAEEVDTVCEIQQKMRDENAEGEPASADWLGIFPAGTTIDSDDAVEVDGIGRFEVIGAPWSARNPRKQTVSHIEATLRRTGGAVAS